MYSPNIKIIQQNGRKKSKDKDRTIDTQTQPDWWDTLVLHSYYYVKKIKV